MIDVVWVLVLGATNELAAILGIDKELDRRVECGKRAGETAGTASQTRQIMSEFGIVAFDRIGLAFVGQGLMLAGVVDQVGVSGQLIRVILARGGRAIEQGLQAFWLAVSGDVVGNDAAAGAIYLRDEVDPLFFCPANVYSSSSSTTGRRARGASDGGTGGVSGRVAA